MAAPAVPKSAKDIVKQFLDQYGLGGLTNWAWNVYRTAGGGTTGMDAINAELPNQAIFKTRFPAYEEMAKRGAGMTVADMVNYENTAKQIFHAAGLPNGFYDSNKELGQFMLNNVSVNELQARVADEQKAVISSPQDVRDQMAQLYGIDHGHLTAFFLDPTKAEPIIAQKFTAAQIAAQATRADVGQLNVTQAENLAQLGVTDASAGQGFQQLGQAKGLFEAQVQGEEQIGLDTQLAGQFGGQGSTEAQLAFAKRKAQRLADFSGKAGFGVGQQGVTGLEQTTRQ